MKEIHSLLLQAAETNAYANFILGTAYLSGIAGGVTVDVPTAINYLTKAAMLGDGNAMVRLAMCYEQGQGVEVNEDKAFELNKRAADLYKIPVAQYRTAKHFHSNAKTTKSTHHFQAEALRYYKLAASGRHLAAQHLLGKLYQTGDALVVVADAYESFRYFQMAADNDKSVDTTNMALISSAQCEVGVSYLRGRGVDVDSVLGLDYLRRSATAGYALSQYFVGEWYEQQEEFAFAQSYYRLAAEQNHVESMVRLGVLLLHGRGVEKSPEAAVHYFQQAIYLDAGHLEANYLLGYCEKHGVGVDKDEVKAATHFQLAAHGGHVEAAYAVGLFHFYRQDVHQNYDKAFKYFVQAAQHRHIEAMNAVGTCFLQNKGAFHSDRKAFDWFKLAADLGNHANAQFRVATLYHSGCDGVNKDVQQAVAYYRMAAKQHHEKAQLQLGLCFMNGEGVTKDAFEAVKYLRPSAEKGNSVALLCLGQLYFDGRLHKVERDKGNAAKYFRLSAEKGNAEAQYRLAQCLLNGDGIDRDLKDAARWFRAAADQEHAGALNALGLLHFHGGVGVERSPTLAFQYFSKAAEKSHNDSRNLLGLLFPHGAEGLDDMEKKNRFMNHWKNWFST